jgi:hypothetical protein
MNSLATSAIVFVCVFGGALFGFWLRVVLPEDHLSPASRDLVKLGMGTIATMTALVLGLLVSSAKNAYGAQSAKIILLDRVLSHYGTEAKEARDILQVVVSAAEPPVYGTAERPGDNRRSCGDLVGGGIGCELFADAKGNAGGSDRGVAI